MTERPEASPRVTLAPTSLDRFLHRVQGHVGHLTRISDLVTVVFAVALLLADVTIWATDPEVDKGRLSVSLGVLVPCLGVLAVGSMVLRHRFGARSLLVLAAVGITFTIAVWVIGSGLPPSLAALFALASLTAFVLRHEPGRDAVLLSWAAAAAVVAESVRPFVSAAAYLLVLCVSAFAVATGVGLYLRWSDWRRVAAADAARTQERLEIAREMHDLVAHYVTGMVVQAQAARHVARHRPSAATDALASIEAAGTEAMSAMRSMVGGLRSDTSASPATWEDVKSLIAHAVAEGLPIHTTIASDVYCAAPVLIGSAHRILTEALTNVRRHARNVSAAEIDVQRQTDRLIVRVCNDGTTTAAQGPDGFGIVGMRERASALGGSLNAGPTPEGGWLVEAILPMNGHQ